VITFSSAAFAQECDEVLHHGIYDFNHSTIDLNMTTSYMNWFCSEEFKKDDKADTFKGSIGFPIKGLPFKLGSDFNSTNVSEWQSKLCTGFKSDKSLQLKVQEALETINPHVIEAWKECVNNGNDGLHVWLVRSLNPKVFHIDAKWNPPAPEDHPTTIASLTTDPWENCQPKKKTIKHQPNGAFRCDRTDLLKPVTISVEATNGPIVGGDKLSLAGESAIGPAGWSPPHTERNAWAFASDDIRNCAPSDIDGLIIDSVPTPPGNDYFFTVQCRPDHSSAHYAINMAVAQPGENALAFQRRTEKQLGTRVTVTSNPYHSIVQSSYWYWYAYRLQ